MVLWLFSLVFLKFLIDCFCIHWACLLISFGSRSGGFLPLILPSGLTISFLRFGNRSFAYERHPHRYEVDPDMVQQFEDAGLSFTGKDESDRHMEVSVAIDIGT